MSLLNSVELVQTVKDLSRDLRRKTICVDESIRQQIGEMCDQLFTCFRSATLFSTFAFYTLQVSSKALNLTLSRYSWSIFASTKIITRKLISQPHFKSYWKLSFLSFLSHLHELEISETADTESADTEVLLYITPSQTNQTFYYTAKISHSMVRHCFGSYWFSFSLRHWHFKSRAAKLRPQVLLTLFSL